MLHKDFSGGIFEMRKKKGSKHKRMNADVLEVGGWL
jgi:hypothetical protein